MHARVQTSPFVDHSCKKNMSVSVTKFGWGRWDETKERGNPSDGEV